MNRWQLKHHIIHFGDGSKPIQPVDWKPAVMTAQVLRRPLERAHNKITAYPMGQPGSKKTPAHSDETPLGTGKTKQEMDLTFSAFSDSMSPLWF